MVAVARARKGLGDRLLEPDFIPTEFASGVVVDRSGLILTNYHVLGRPRGVRLRRVTGRRGYRATILAADRSYDLAVLKLADGSIDSLRPIPLGDADKLRKGRIVIALGNPLATARDGEAAASWGIVSNLARKAAPDDAAAEQGGRKSTLHQFGTLIQTDVRLDRGASGGALINLHGEMVGLTTAVGALPGDDGAAGFAIPVNDTFRHVVKELSAGRAVAYGFLGVAPDPTYRPNSPGVRLTNVVRGTPAAKAGLRVGDVITHVAEAPLHAADDLFLQVSKHPAGSRVQLRLVRGGRPQTSPVRLSKKYHARLGRRSALRLHRAGAARRSITRPPIRVSSN